MLLGRVDHPVSSGSLIAAIVFLVFVYSFPGKLLKTAFVLFGGETLLRFALAHVHAGYDVQESCAFGASLAQQIAFILVLVWIVQWFKSVVRRVPLTIESGDS